MAIDKLAAIEVVRESSARLLGLTYVPPTIKSAEGAIFEAYVHTCVAEAIDALICTLSEYYDSGAHKPSGPKG
jgi:hypothetical protein